MQANQFQSRTDTNHKTDRRTDTANSQNKGTQAYNQNHEEKIPPGRIVFEPNRKLLLLNKESIDVLLLRMSTITKL